MTLFDQMLLSIRLLLSNKYKTMPINSFNFIEVDALLSDNRRQEIGLNSQHNSRRILNNGITQFTIITEGYIAMKKVGIMITVCFLSTLDYFVIFSFLTVSTQNINNNNSR